MSTILKNPGELQIDLSNLRSFSEMKHELEQRLESSKNFAPGTQVRVHVGERHLSSKQVRELEDILLDYGLHLRDLMCNGPPDEEGDAEKEGPFYSMPHYDRTILVCRHLRSGQKLFSEGNVVVLGDVNPGAEVIAGGNILVMGSLRGMAHAGAFGDDSAVISAYRLSPTQLRIANHITRPPDGEVIVVENPELARIRAGKVVIEKLKI